MFLDDRSVNILHELIRTPQIKNKELEDKFNLSRRQVAYSLEKINQWLQTKNLVPITKSRNGNFIIDKKIFAHFSDGTSHSGNLKEYIPTEKERALLIILYLLGKREGISLFHIIDLLNVSKNTGISDIKEAAELIKKYSLSIVYTRSGGYDIIGDEFQIRKLLIVVVKSVLNFFNGHHYFEKFLHLDISSTQEKVRSIEESLNIHLTDESYESLPYMIELIFSRIEQGHLLHADFFVGLDELADTEEYAASKLLLKEDMEIPIPERIWLTLQLLTSNVRSADILTNERIQDLKTAIGRMIELFEKKTCLFIVDKEDILDKLLLHMRPAYYRIKYHLTLKNQFSAKMIEEYMDLHEMVTASIEPLENLMGETFPPGEIAFITMFLAGQLIKQGEELNKKKRALVVCTNGLTISKIMQQTLKEIFPEFYFAESLSLRQFQEYPLDYEIVFSTIPVQSEKPMYLINPLMTLSEKESLRKQVINTIDKESYATINISRLIATIKENAIVTDEMALLTSLSKLFQEGQKNEPKEVKNVTYGLQQFLPSEFIQLRDQVETWQEAITIACEPLVKSNIVKPSYVTMLIEENDHKQIYSFLGSKMAIPHGAPEKGVMADAFAMLILKQPVEFANGHKVSIVTPLAIYNQNRHLKALAQLVELAEDEEKISKLLDVNDSSDAWFIVNGC
ncbi:BglG family transcription antiterminator [Neobacillus sp. MM2021_6]|uniref:BglG family transcription antiterminator n=1 Tax=Bacillaceae TaxID=186817 RepID=UPI00140BA0B8|nr:MULTISPECIES: BglG family transcription antiterminator [Bacillaceae]MBO0958682.1 BglG family transcription antiterminator [Neobacillus sp. MM2021_6]NHC18223.1 BglG family transcription antiterminator [Bacillus sp. MM2020_4]